MKKLVVMGVAGSGKSTLGLLRQHRLLVFTDLHGAPVPGRALRA